MIPTIAILGRPNVGKSTLFNRLVGRKIALVDDQPGITRDRREGLAELGGLSFKIFDTAGLDDAKKDSLEARMSEQSVRAVEGADLVFFVIDARVGVTPTDKAFAERIRKLGKPVRLLANKAEARSTDVAVQESYSLGFGEPIAISAEHGEGLDAIFEIVREFNPPTDDNEVIEEERFAEEDDILSPEDKNLPLRLAIIGQPNAGKSTLVNALLGEERMLTGPEAGITRDAIATSWQWQGHDIKLWDTAGIRRKSRVQEKVEKLSVTDALRAIRFADCVIVLIDASQLIERQDLTLLDLVGREGKAVVLALSKWDLVEDKQKVLADVHSKMEDVLPEIRGVQVVTLSAKQERGLDRLMQAVMDTVARWRIRISTGQLNRWLEGVMARNPPPAPSGRRIKIRYATQVETAPPTFAIFGNQLAKMPDSYQRYLTNSLRKDFDLKGVPIRLNLRGGKNPFDKDKR